MTAPVVTFAQQRGHRHAVRFTYNATAVDLIKTVPAWARSWDPKRRLWLVDSGHVPGLKLAFERLGYTVVDIGAPQPKPVPEPASSWAVALFAALPERLHEPVFRALVRVLHPDIGGDPAAMKQLNQARPSSRRAAA